MAGKIGKALILAAALGIATVTGVSAGIKTEAVKSPKKTEATYPSEKVLQLNNNIYNQDGVLGAKYITEVTEGTDLYKSIQLAPGQTPNKFRVFNVLDGMKLLEEYWKSEDAAELIGGNNPAGKAFRKIRIDWYKQIASEIEASGKTLDFNSRENLEKKLNPDNKILEGPLGRGSLSGIDNGYCVIVETGTDADGKTTYRDPVLAYINSGESAISNNTLKQGKTSGAPKVSAIKNTLQSQKPPRQTKREKKALEFGLISDIGGSISSKYLEADLGFQLRRNNVAFGLLLDAGWTPDKLMNSYSNSLPFGITTSGKETHTNYLSVGASGEVQFGPLILGAGAGVTRYIDNTSTDISQFDPSTGQTYSHNSHDSRIVQNGYWKAYGGFGIPLSKNDNVELREIVGYQSGVGAYDNLGINIKIPQRARSNPEKYKK